MYQCTELKRLSTLHGWMQVMIMNELDKLFLPSVSDAPEQEAWTPAVQRYLLNSALDYHAQHADKLPGFEQGGLDITAAIIQKAFLDGLSSLETDTVPRTATQARATLKDGL